MRRNVGVLSAAHVAPAPTEGVGRSRPAVDDVELLLCIKRMSTLTEDGDDGQLELGQQAVDPAQPDYLRCRAHPSVAAGVEAESGTVQFGEAEAAEAAETAEMRSTGRLACCSACQRMGGE